MAKKGTRIKIALDCKVCKRRNYITSRNKINTPDKLALVKYCPHCKTRREHKEVEKMK